MRAKSFLSAAVVMLVAATAARAEVKTRTVQYEEGGVKLIGYLAWDDAAKEKRPGVMVVPEWWGLTDYARQRAVQLAELGYVGFAADMYGGGKTTDDPKVAGEWAGAFKANVPGWRSRALAGLTTLKAQAEVDPSRTAAMGYCFGGSTAIQMAYAGADLASVVSFHGALPAYDAATDGKIKARLLICHGAADTFVPETQVVPFRDALDKAGADWQMVYYSGAKHSFTNPDADRHGLEGIKYNKAADHRSWHHMQDFFKETLSKTPADPTKKEPAK